MALDTTVGGASADSYGTLAEYVAYVVANIDASFASTSEVSLRRAAQHIDRGHTFAGYKAASTQALSWPRVTSIYIDGWPVASDTIPQSIKDAQFEIAYAIEVDGLNPMAVETNGAVKSERSKAGPVETQVEYANPRSGTRITAAERLLRPYMGGHSSAQVRMLRG